MAKIANERYSLFPIKHPEFFEYYNTMIKLNWFAFEIDATKDNVALTKMDKNELHFIHSILAFFNQSDGLITENLACRFMSDVLMPEARAFYGMQIANETTHSETYSKLLQEYISDEDQRNKMFNAIDNYDAIAMKAKWAKKWIASDASFAKRLIAFVLIEGVFFSGSFCAIYWLKEKHKGLSGLAHANDYISRDETLHCKFAVSLYKFLRDSETPNDYLSDNSGGFTALTKEEIYEIVSEAVETEKVFMTESLPVSLIGMNKDLMIDYIKAAADFWLKELGFEPLYKVTDPFGFMVKLGMEKKKNFFEKVGTEYQKKPVDDKIRFDDEF